MPHLAKGGRSLQVAPARGREGFFRVGRDAADRWWLIEPGGSLLFACCVHDVSPAPATQDQIASSEPEEQLRAWGFNAVGVVGGGESEVSLPRLASVEFCEAGPLLIAPGLRLPDVFDPDWPVRAAQQALQVCAPAAEDRTLIGWMSDTSLAWAQASTHDRPTLLQLCLSLEPGYATYHAAWEFVLALHGGRLETLARAWGLPNGNKEVVRELTRSETGIATRGYWRDQARWTREFARRYFSTTAAAVRAADENHLVMGCRFREVAGSEVLAECTYPTVDVAMPHWRELPPAGTNRGTNPVLADSLCWADPELSAAPADAIGGGLTAVERMLRQARTTLGRLARHPAVVGYAWGQWLDEPGEQPPFARGLMHRNGVAAREHAEMLAQFNHRVENLRRTSKTSSVA